MKVFGIFQSLAKGFLLIVSAVSLSSCTSLLTDKLMNPVVDNLQKQTDVELVCEGAPSFLLMLDSMTAAKPEDKAMLINAAKSYTGYVAALNTCEPGSRRLEALNEKGALYGRQLLSLSIPVDGKTEELDEALSHLTKKDVPGLFWGSAAWIGWIQQQEGSPESMVVMNTVKKVMEKILLLNPGYQDGGAHLFMGTYLASVPAMLGGKPEEARMHFEQALQITDRQALMIQVAYAQTYCRTTMNKELHDSLLQEVLDFPIASDPSRTLTNQIAKRQAEKLLQEDFFME